MAARIVLVMLGLGLAALPALGDTPEPKGVEYFEKKVRPILVERCYSCHSAQAKKLRGGLFLDSKPGWTKGGDTGPAIVPGNLDESLIIEAVRYKDELLKMPPKGKLPDEEIAVLETWVKSGAHDPRTETPPAPQPRKTSDIAAARQLWSFRPLQAPSPPKVAAEGWCRTPIDRFILAKLEAKAIKPNDAVSRRQLARRVYFDLIGLPPTPEELAAFLNDSRPDAYDRLIDHLLESPHYGERWGRHWLDLARFAESHGFEHDYDRLSAYHYRDFVIEALNQDMPYDTFVKWQIAGDELAPNDNLALKATGYLAAGVHSTQITANQVEKERYDELDDIVSTIGTSMLGLTIGCARCHDHKYDPIPTRDYYRFLSTFTTTVRSEIDLNLDRTDYEKAKAAYEKAHVPYVAALASFETEQLPARFAAWEASRSKTATGATWITLDPVKAESKGGATLTRQSDGSYLASGKNPDFDTYTFVANVKLKGMTAVRLEALADPSFVKGGPGRAPNGNFDLTDFKVSAAPKGGKDSAIALQNAKADFEQSGLPIKAAIDDNPKSGWAVDPQIGKSHTAVFEFPTDIGDGEETALTFTLDFQGNNGHNIGRLRLAVTSAPRPVGLEGSAIPQEIVRILDTPRDQRKPEQAKVVLAWYRAIDAEWQKLNKAADDHAKAAPKPPTVKALISSEGLPAVRLHTQGGDFLEKTHFLKRGDPNQKLDEAPPGFLQVLTNAPEQEKHWQVEPPKGWRTSYRRLALASWITDPDYGAGHLLARVIVNRLWQHHLGRGIVATPSDFGAQGDKPTHPELLDWLAAELIKGGWRLKPIHKLIVQSAVYQEGSEIDEAKARIDHDNTLFWHFPRHRLEAEVIRDAMLSVGGMLDPRMYGPGVLDEHMKRRSIYFTVKRSKLIPMMMLFDAPDALQAAGLRPNTTVATQSLMLMNSLIVREWATGFARRIAPRASEPLEVTVERGYLTALGRPPDKDELAEAMAFIERQKASYGGPANAAGTETALADFCQVLMSLNEFVFVE